jgi:hypothetical protein
MLSQLPQPPPKLALSRTFTDVTPTTTDALIALVDAAMGVEFRVRCVCRLCFAAAVCFLLV